MRRESRADFQRYIGNRKTLDGFFSKVRLEQKKKFPGAEIKMGRNEDETYRARRGGCPGTFKACVRVVAKDPATGWFKESVGHTMDLKKCRW